MAENFVIGENKSLRKLSEAMPSVTLLEKKTWQELKALRDAENLQEGALYRITDYDCILNPSNTMTTSAHHPFDIVVLALSKNNLSETAWATLHEGDTYFINCNLSAWTLGYCLDNDQTRFAWAGSDDDGGKGVIFYMKDENALVCDYDFKNIMMKRFLITATTNSDYMTTDYYYYTARTSCPIWTINTASPSFFYTFSASSIASPSLTEVIDISVQKASSGNVRNISFFSQEHEGKELSPSCFVYIPRKTTKDPTDVWWRDIKTGSAFCNNTFGSLVKATFGDDCSYNTFGSCSKITLGHTVWYINIGTQSEQLVFENGARNISLGYNSGFCFFSSNCTTITAKMAFLNNFFCPGNATLTFGNTCQNNFFGPSSQSSKSYGNSSSGNVYWKS